MTVTDTDDRQRLLREYGRWYGQEHLAIAFTSTNQGEEAKRVTTQGWDTTRPLPTEDWAEALISERGLTHNIAIVLRPSNLIVLECDTEEDLLRIQSLELPHTITVRSSKPYKRHFYYRPADTLPALPYVAFRFESGKLTADSGRYFLAPPSIHPTGAVYAFLPNHGPGETDLAELPEHIYRDLTQQAGKESAQQRERIQHDPTAKVHAGNRGDSLFRFASMLRRWGIPRSEILTAAIAWNQARCDPPIERERVEIQVEGAMRQHGNQELERARQHPLPDPPDPEEDDWDFVDLSDPQYAEPPEPPVIHGLIYSGLRHVISGPPESAKTLVAYALLLEALRNGHAICVIDFEMGRKAARRLLSELGATLEEIKAIYYIDPNTPPTPERVQRLIDHNIRYVLTDASAGAYDATGLDDNSRKDAEKFARIWIHPLWTAGVATIVIDHVTKDKDTRGKFTIGSERKTGQADVHLSLEALKPLTRGGTGVIKAHVHKDRPGFLPRPTATLIELASNTAHHISVTFKDPEQADETTGHIRPTVLMERVSRYLEQQSEAVSRNSVELSVQGKGPWLRTALDVLTNEGFIAETKGEKRARMVSSLRPFRGSETPSDANSTQFVPSSSHLVRDELGVVRPTSSPPLKGGRRDEVTHHKDEPPVRPSSHWQDDLVDASELDRLNQLYGDTT